MCARTQAVSIAPHRAFNQFEVLIDTALGLSDTEAQQPSTSRITL